MNTIVRMQILEFNEFTVVTDVEMSFLLIMILFSGIHAFRHFT